MGEDVFMMDITKKVAEILVECGYARKAVDDYIVDIACGADGIAGIEVPSDPFIDTIEGRRQADAIEDYLVQKKKHLWLSSMGQFGFDDRPKHQWRLDRIKWCLLELCK